jgi:hypothetical protein
MRILEDEVNGLLADGGELALLTRTTMILDSYRIFLVTRVFSGTGVGRDHTDVWVAIVIPTLMNYDHD